MILIGTDEGIYRWFDGNPWPIFHGLQDRSIAALTAGGGGFVGAVDAAGRILESLDNGMTWRSLPLPDGLDRASAIAAIATPATLVVAARPLGLFARLAGTSTQTRRGALDLARDLGPMIVRRARSLRGGPAVVEAPRRGKSAQGQAAVVAVDPKGWTRLGLSDSAGAGVRPSVRALAVGATAADPIFAAVDGAGLWASRDSGSTWARCAGLPAGEVYAVRTSPKTPGLVVAGTAAGCWVSTDSGATWEDRSGGLGDALHVRSLEVHPDDPKSLLAGAASGPFDGKAVPRESLGFKLYESSDGGKSWAHVKRGMIEDLEYDTIADIRFDPAEPRNIVVALGSGELRVSRNGGEYWSPLARQIKAVRALAAASS
jgi:photosystem II stability/assembly factor-like uncharacterized protein